MKKRILAWLLSIAIIVGAVMLNGCGNGIPGGGNASSDSSHTTTIIDNTTSTNANPDVQPSITFTGMTGFMSSETALVVFTREVQVYSEENSDEPPETVSTKYYGLVNSKGKVYYQFEPSPDFSYSIADFGKEHILLLKTNLYNRTQIFYTVVDSDGNVTFSSENRNDFDTILCYGEEMFLVYKDTSNINNKEYSYGVLDCNGNWVAQLSPGPYDVYNYIYRYKWSGKFTNNMFMVYAGGTYCYYNYNSNLWFTLQAANTVQQSLYVDFNNGSIYGNAIDRSGYDKYSTLTIFNGEKKNLPTYFKISSNGIIDEITLNEFKKNYFPYGEITLTKEDDGQKYLSFIDYINNTLGVYKDFNCNSIANEGSLEGKLTSPYVIVKVSGADGKYYHILLNNKGKALCEPIQSSTCDFIDGDRVLFYNGKYYQILKRIICNAIWLINDKTGTLGSVPDKIPDYEYEAIARSFLSFMFDYFGKEENMREFEEWRERKTEQETRVQA